MTVRHLWLGCLCPQVNNVTDPATYGACNESAAGLMVSCVDCLPE